MLLGAEGERVHVDARIRGTGVVLEGLDLVEVGSLTLREAVLAVELELGRDDRVLAPAVHVKSSLGEHEGAGIGHIGAGDTVGLATRGAVLVEGGVVSGSPLLVDGEAGVVVHGTSLLEKAGSVDEGVGAGGLRGATEGVDGVGEGVDGVRVVERLGTQSTVKCLAAVKGGTVVDVGVGLDNPDELLAGVVEVELDLVRGRADGLVTRELELLNEVLMGVLCHLAALIRIEENVIDVEGSGDKGLLVGLGNRDGASGAIEGLDGPEALADGLDVKVDLNLVVLKSDERKSKSGVAAEPEEERDVERRLGEGIARSADLVGASGGRARAGDGGELGVRDVRKLSGVTNELEVSTLLLGGHGELVPDVHPVAILAVNALATDLNLNLGDELLANVVEPTGINTVVVGSSGGLHVLVNLRERNLEVRAVAEIAIAADGASHTATKIGLTREGLLDGLHREVRVAAVRHLPESNFGRSRKEDVLSAVSDKLHKSSTHVRGFITLVQKKILKIAK